MSTAAEVFGIMDAAVRDAGAALVNQVKGTIKFDVTGAGQWLIQCKTAPAGVTKSSADAAADVTVTLSEANFLLLIADKLNPQQAYMQGKIKFKGNMGLAMKLSAVINAYKQKVASGAAAAAAPAATPAATTTGLRSAGIFASIGEAIKAKGPELVGKVKGTIQFNITPGGTWFVDLKNGAGSIETATKPADLTITVSDADFMSIADGKLNAQQAFMKGKLKLKGNMGLAMKLPVVIDAAKARSKL
ncbi:Aste57867_1309 [Aphanomyces stellatus]|uniref:Aste57867_1309 protein n=1 Tax=Aphanomyces stellatus TaxID=120398 RepID=A0A485K889_9STRA|nr:hypothetical protein As57867_001308 [Aphanomyces stellatus]VFT78528.1 Aste57867_1309 [Aphanomyces stellatus]